MLTLELLLFVGLFSWIYFLWSRRRLYGLLLQLPGPMGLPLLGIAVEYLIFYKRKMKIRTKYMDQYGSTILTWLGPMPFIMTRDPKIVEEVFMSPECINRSSQFTIPLTSSAKGDGLLSIEANRWIERRKHMNHTFRHNILLSFLPIFNAEAKSLVTFLGTQVGQGEKKILNDIVRWSFRVATQTTVGTDVKQDKSFENDTILKSYESLLHLITMNVMLPFTHNKIISTLCGFEEKRAGSASHIEKMIDKIIDKKLNSKPESGAEPEITSVINKAIELYRKGELPLGEVRAECTMMVVAAFETTGVTVCHTLTLLAMFPECQQTVFEELKDLYPTAGDFEVTYEDVQKMVYLERVLNETLRLIPSVPFVPREATQDFRLSNGVVIPKGVTIGVDIFNTHRNKEFWGPDADKFNPDHFLPDNVRDRHPYAYIPFSKGRRNCIGWKYGMMSSKLALAKILRNYKVTTSFRFEDLDFVDNVGMELALSPGIEFHRRT
ncbi:probable cytochrome P450 313a3 [Drosophila takahashii]|uniref:probable cytochrome P450 313a3 n=1 Tax=Drosophila takahashii TaxID=29030 RepID=UPI0038991267